LKHAQSCLLDEWERSLGTPREQARREMKWVLNETPARKHQPHDLRPLRLICIVSRQLGQTWCNDVACKQNLHNTRNS
jgi:hypothetical protein